MHLSKSEFGAGRGGVGLGLPVYELLGNALCGYEGRFESKGPRGAELLGEWSLESVKGSSPRRAYFLAPGP